MSLVSLVFNKIKGKEEDFLDYPNRRLANELIDLWKEVALNPANNTYKAKERILLYRNFVSGNGSEIMEVLGYELSPSVAVLTVHKGRYNSGRIEEMLKRQINKSCPSNDASKHLIEISVRYIKPISCSNCPEFKMSCSSLTCENKNQEELSERIERLKELY